MTTTLRMRAIIFSALMLIQVIAPITYAVPSSGPDVIIETEVDLDLLSTVGLAPSPDIAHGWFNPADGVGQINLLYRDMGVVALEDWPEWTGESSKLDGWYVLTHEYPVPSEWFDELDDAGIDCFSFLPPNGFHCELNGQSLSELEQYDVEGIVQVDATDKIRENLVRGITGIETTPNNPYATEGFAVVNLVLSGTALPEGIESRDDIVVEYHRERQASVLVEPSALQWLATQGAIEWIEARPWATLDNNEAVEIMDVDHVWDSSTMTGINSSWTHLDGSGVIVAVADSGLDNGVNNSLMHPDFRDHIVDIVSMPLSAGQQTWCGASSNDDGAADTDSGHGTHVAGSVLGDGTNSGGSIKGAAPEARLYMQAIGQWCPTDVSSSNGGWSLRGLPSDLFNLFEPAYDNGSQVHTNSWGSGSNPGSYNSMAMQADSSAVLFPDMIILFSAGNAGTDASADGEVDEDTIGNPGTAKNVLTIGAGENDRSTINNYWGTSTSSGAVYSPPISTDKMANNSEGMAAFSSRGPTDDGRIKPDMTAPGTYILSTKSRSTSATGWGAYASNPNYTYMGGTSMSCPLTAGAAALIIQHLMENEGESSPNSSLVKAIFAASARDMTGQYGSVTNGAGETAPNIHEGWGMVNLSSAVNTSWVDGDSVITDDERGWSFAVPPAAPDMRIVLSWTDPASTPAASTHLVNNLNLAIKDPAGTWTNTTNSLDNLLGLTFTSPAQGSWEVHVLGESVPISGTASRQFFSLAINADYNLANLTQDADLDGTEDSSDDCAFTFGTSTVDRNGCPDTDGDGYSDPSFNWSIVNGADAFITQSTQWADQDGDGYGDNSAGVAPDDCITVIGLSSGDRYGCPDPDFDTFSSADPSGTNGPAWLISDGADSCPGVWGNSSTDRTGCTDEDGDTYSDPDPSGTNGPVWLTSDDADAFLGDDTQWADADGDGFGDNPPPATLGDECPAISGTSSEDRTGCVDTDGDGYSDADSVWLAHPTGTADAFPSDITQWLDSDGDGYGDNPSGTNPDECVNDLGSGVRSSIDRLGCPDSDGDGYSDADLNWAAHPLGLADAFPITASQWHDTDGDGYGDEALGANPDACVSVAGNSLHDRLGCPDADSDGYSDPDPLGNNGSVWIAHPVGMADAFSNEPTQWADTDADGYGDNQNGVFPDHCVADSGTSTADRYGCLDTDGDNYSDPTTVPLFTVADGADVAPSDPLRWSDSDLDGISDQIDDACPTFFGNSTEDRIGCPDTDGDGYSDPDPNWTPTDNGSDAFKTNPTQWEDTDGDGFGDNPAGTLADDCPLISGSSWQNNTLGCVDTDQDGWADQEDAQVNEPSQWSDIDGDGYGDNLGGATPDACPSLAGNSTLGNRMGCPDTDGDGWDDVADQLPNLANQWLDQDADGYGDNATGPQPDACPGIAGNSTIDRYGCIDDDGDGMSNESDAFPNDPTRTQDTDGDGFDDLEDSCINSAGNSTIDRNACPDTDGDGYSDPTLPFANESGWNSSDGADALPLNPTQWSDSDGDGYGDNATGTQPDSCPSVEGYSNVDLFGCPDEDNDGASQDAFPDDSTQWEDLDGDGFGDNPNGTQPDNCTTVIGTSHLDVYGCPDADGDGASDTNDLWANDSSQWFDTDGDGWGDNTQGTDGDACPTLFGNAALGNAPGCIDNDGDGYADSDDAFPDEPTQWVDVDGDGFGDNQSSGASRPDHWIEDPSRNVAEAELTCTPGDIELDLAGEDYFSYSCTIVSVLSDITIRVEWQQISSIIASEQIQVLTFTNTTGLTQTVLFSGEGRSNGDFELYVTIKEPGVDVAMDSVSVNLKVFDSRIVDESDLITDESSGWNDIMEKPIVQALFGGIVLFFLMGMLMIRGNASNARHAEERVEHAREVIAARMNRKNEPPKDSLRQALREGGRVPPPPPPRPPIP